MARLETWFKTERMHRHEVRGKTIATRLKFELEYARDQELVLQQHQSPEFKPFVLAKCQEKLEFFQVVKPSRRQERWMSEIVRPRIGALGRTGQKLSESVDRALDESKAKLTWATSDRFQHLVARGSVDELRLFVAEPETFVENRRATSVMVCDAYTRTRRPPPPSARGFREP